MKRGPKPSGKILKRVWVLPYQGDWIDDYLAGKFIGMAPLTVDPKPVVPCNMAEMQMAALIIKLNNEIAKLKKNDA